MFLKDVYCPLPLPYWTINPFLDETFRHYIIFECGDEYLKRDEKVKVSSKRIWKNQKQYKS